MNKTEVFSIIQAKEFFTYHCHIASWRHKLYGSTVSKKSGAVRDFSDTDRKAINAALGKLKFKID
jgi:hypothetical protein